MIEAIQKLKQLEAAKFSEVCEKHTFECYRLRSDGCMQEVTVVILDAGPDSEGRARYYCHAKSAEGKEVSSSLEPSLDAAFASIRWSDLDPDAESDGQLPAATQPEMPAADAPAARRRGEYGRRDLFDRFRKTLARTSGDGEER